MLEKKIDVFLGIPFAHPPVGDLRFRPLEPLPAPNDTSVEYDAIEPPSFCSQTLFQEVDVGSSNMSEDCLYLNIWKPHGRRSKAVVVSLHSHYTYIIHIPTVCRVVLKILKIGRG